MKNRDYWKERFQQLEEASHKKGIEYCHMLDEQYRKAVNELEKEIRSWYQRIAKNNNISMTDAKKLLNKNELDEFKWSVDDYIKYGKQNAVDGKWMKQLENASAKFHITRLEALKLHTQQAIEKLYGNQLDYIDELMRNIYTDNMYHAAFEVQKGFQVGFSFAKVNEDKLNKIINKPWAVDGRNFSDRIWTNKTKLINEIHTELTQMCTLGKLPENSVKNIAKKMNVSLNRAKTLVMTEASYFQTISDYDTFKKLGVEQYEIVATLDSITSEICQEMDGKVFKMSEFEISTTAPPFHPNCRTVVVPYFDDNFDIGERAARNENGETYYVSDDMTYREWSEVLVQDEIESINASEIDDNHQVFKPVKSDIKWSRYIEVEESTSDLLNEVHTTLNEFMNKERREKMYLIDSSENIILKDLEGQTIDRIDLTKDVFNVLKNAKPNSVIFTHVHPSSTPFSRPDLEFMFNYKSIKAYTLECANGDKFILDRGDFKNSFLNKLNFPSTYDKIYHKMAKNYPELNDPVKIYSIWDDFIYDVIDEVARHYGMVFKKVGD